MKRIHLILYVSLFSLIAKAQTDSLSGNYSCEFNPPAEWKLKNADEPFGKKFWRGFAHSMAYDATMSLSLILLPQEISKWETEDRFKLETILAQYERSFTQPPVFDHDLFVINYIGHPYQGSLYYNTIRSQGGTILQSSLFCVGQTLAWEYIWEGGMEQPSIQDLIVTPIVGTLVGELSHRATMGMRKNGFEWYEKVVTVIINPSYVLNNGFKNKK